ncbi:MAG: ABC transporter ATP-binding protein [Deltaproteobacteria bacterium]|nr:MAG: ABC transporter ATP-binding protein [Deltaproteobacteria bacterium]
MNGEWSQKKVADYLSEIFKKPESRETQFRYRDILFFIPFVRPLWKLGVISLILTIVTTGLGSLLPLSSKVFIDFVIMKKGGQQVENFLVSIGLTSLIHPIQYILGSVNIVILLILIIGIIMGLIRIVQSIMTLRLQQEITFNIQTALFDRVLRFPMSVLKEKQVGYLMSRVSNDVSMLQYFFSSAVPQLLTNTLYFLFSFGILFTLSSRLSLILLGLLPVWGLINYFFASRVRAVSYKDMERQAQISKDMQEIFSGVEVIKTHVSEEREVAKLSVKIRNLFRTRIKTTILSSLSAHSMRASKLITTLLIVWLSVHEIEKGRMTIGDMTALMAYVIYLSGLAGSISGMFLTLQTVFAGIERLTEMFNVVPEFGSGATDNGQKTADVVRGDIRFENVSFSYKKDKPVLEDISFTVCSGDVIALTGASGAGKTTLINLLIKFNLPQSGSIYLDDYDLKELDTQWLRKQAGFVSQDIFLFNDTIEANIKYGKPSASQNAVIQAARDANIHNEIEKFQDGYRTMVGERGVKLSVGQRQRISIARAFLRDPRILLCDEPTSALDAETESVLKDSLKKLAQNRTVFMITHRMSVADIATRVFLLERGRVREQKTEDR